MEEIRADIEALEQETDGLLGQTLVKVSSENGESKSSRPRSCADLCPRVFRTTKVCEKLIIVVRSTYSQLEPTGSQGGVPITRWQLRNNLLPEVSYVHS